MLETKPKKLLCIVHHLHDNPIARAQPFVEMFQERGWEVEVIGAIVKGRSIYGPYKNLCAIRPFEYDGSFISLFKAIRAMNNYAKADAIYCFKPMLTTLVPSVLISKKNNIPLLLDVEDDDFGGYLKWGLRSVAGFALKGWLDPCDPKYLLLISRLNRNACFRSVSTEALSIKYGGYVTRICKSQCNMSSDEILDFESRNRNKYNLPKNKILALFAGKSRFHKGLVKFVNVLKDMPECNIHLVLAGEPDQKDFRYAKSALGDRCSELGAVSADSIDEVFVACDFVVCLQEFQNTYAEAQLPAKLLQSLVNGTPALVTNVGDLPKIVRQTSASNNEGTYGWVLDEWAELPSVLNRISLQLSDYDRKRELKTSVFEHAVHEFSYHKTFVKITQTIENRRMI